MNDEISDAQRERLFESQDIEFGNPMRGVVYGILFSIPIWVFLIGLGWLVWLWVSGS